MRYRKFHLRRMTAWMEVPMCSIKDPAVILPLVTWQDFYHAFPLRLQLLKRQKLCKWCVQIYEGALRNKV